MNDWIAAGIAVVAALVLGPLAGRLVANSLGKPTRPDPVRSAAGPLSSLVFSAVLVAGLMTALGFVKRDALEDIPNDLVDYLPKVLSAAIVLILANVAAQLVAATLERTVARFGAGARNVPAMVRWTILGFGVVLAAAQLGIDTTILNITVAAILFSAGLSVALMVGLGSRTVSAEVAAGRVVRRLVRPGDQVTVDGVTATVVDVGSAATELSAAEGATLLVPNSRLISQIVTVERGEPGPA